MKYTIEHNYTWHIQRVRDQSAQPTVEAIRFYTLSRFLDRAGFRVNPMPDDDVISVSHTHKTAMTLFMLQHPHLLQDCRITDRE
jgi:hypothetical protein